MTTTSDPSPQPSQSAHAAIAEQIIGAVAQASSPVLSPDGSLVAFVVTRTDMAKNKYFSQVWLADTDGSSPPRPVTAGDLDGNPTWSPDGRTLAFTSKRSTRKKDATLHLLPIGAAGEVRQVAAMRDGLSEPAFSPDGRWIAFISRTQDERYSVPGADDGDESWQPPRKIERFFTQLNGEGWTFDRPAHVYVVAGGRHGHAAEPHARASSSTATSPGCRTTAVSSPTRSDTTHGTSTSSRTSTSVGLDGSVRPLTAQTGIHHHPSVSPDGSSLAMLGLDDASTYPQNVKVGVLPIGGGEHRWISTGLDRSFETTAGTATPRWLDDTTLLATAEDRGETHIVRVTTDGATPTKVTQGAISVKGFDARNGVVAYCGVGRRPGHRRLRAHRR